VPRIVEGSHTMALWAGIAVLADEISRHGRRLAREAVDAGVVVGRARTSSPRAPGTVVRRVGHVRQHPEVIVERVVLLHHDDDVIDVLQVAVGTRRRGAESQRRENQRRTERGVADQRGLHDPELLGLQRAPVCQENCGMTRRTPPPSRAQYSGSRSKRWWASMKRTVRVAERMTTELVTAPPFT